MYRTIEWKSGIVETIDQTQLPNKTKIIRLRNAPEVANAIREMKIRGAPLIGVSAGYALALTACHSRAKTSRELMVELERDGRILVATRPTAVNLRWAVNRIISKTKEAENNHLRTFVVEEAKRIAEEDYQANLTMGKHGSTLIDDGDVVLTHCNAGALATSGYGSALGVIRAAVEAGKKIKVIASETRPLLQGARLTAYELKKSRIPVWVVTDNAVGHLMQNHMISKAVVGADRILSTGHVFNKIGTYSISVLAKAHQVPLYVAAPTSTLDMNGTLESVKIEEREANEIHFIGKKRITPNGVKVYNPAFDVTPPQNIEAIITEKGVVFPPYTETLAKLVSSADVG
ncbi:MAG: S-methyl-5-thioribose-1-phosphate isomerase [archaeon]